jgi:integrase
LQNIQHDQPRDRTTASPSGGFTRQDLLGHKDVATTMIYTHVMQKPGIGVRSPLDGIG